MSGARLPCVLRATASFVYLRMHGPDSDHLYAGSYSPDSLAWWADRIREWNSQGREVYVHFNNAGEGNAVRDAESPAAPSRLTITSAAAGSVTLHVAAAGSSGTSGTPSATLSWRSIASTAAPPRRSGRVPGLP